MKKRLETIILVSIAILFPAVIVYFIGVVATLEMNPLKWASWERLICEIILITIYLILYDNSNYTSLGDPEE